MKFHFTCRQKIPRGILSPRKGPCESSNRNSLHHHLADRLHTDRLTSCTGNHGNISGIVTDPSGSVIPSATVTATNTGTGVARTTQTTSAGVFFLNNLPVGNYRLSI